MDFGELYQEMMGEKTDAQSLILQPLMCQDFNLMKLLCLQWYYF